MWSLVSNSLRSADAPSEQGQDERAAITIQDFHAFSRLRALRSVNQIRKRGIFLISFIAATCGMYLPAKTKIIWVFSQWKLESS